MRFALLLIALAACRIPGDHFIGIGGGDDAGGDDDGNTADTSFGGPADAALLTSNGWAIETGTLAPGLVHMMKDPQTGALTAAGSGSVNAPGTKWAISNKAGTRLFISQENTGGVATIAQYDLVNGTPTAAGQKDLTGCAPRLVAMHPGGNHLAVGCASAGITIITLVSGNITGSAEAHVPMAPTRGSQSVAWSADGNCLFVTDVNATAGADKVYWARFANNTLGNLTGTPTGPPTAPYGIAVHPNGQWLYVAGDDAVHAYTIGAACALAPLDNEVKSNTTVPSTIVITVSGTRAYTTGAGIFGFDINANDGKLAALPANPVNSTTARSLAKDPAIPNTLFITTPNSVIPVTIASSGALVNGTAATTAGASFSGFVIGR